MNSSEDIISKLKSEFGESLEQLSVQNRYGTIGLLSIAINRQQYPFQVIASHQELIDRMLNSSEMQRILYNCPVVSMPRVIKFLSETIPF